MIAFRDNLPLIRFEDGRVVHFERQWLARAVVDAASRAGYSKWWLADHVIESVASYLKHDCKDNVLAVENLCQAVESVLKVIGYEDVATHFESPHPPVRLSLMTLARHAGTGYELAFFALLRRGLREVLEDSPGRLELTDLRLCVRELRAAKVWRMDCSQLLAEIIRFVHEELDACGANHMEVQVS